MELGHPWILVSLAGPGTNPPIDTDHVNFQLGGGWHPPTRVAQGSTACVHVVCQTEGEAQAEV